MDKNEIIAQTVSTTAIISDEVKPVNEVNADADIKACDNCKKPLLGPYCGYCGQQAESTLKYFWTVILHLLDDILSFDSRASRTIWPLLLRPGFLTNEYIQGRRVHYVPPLRLYLFISIVFFLSIQFFAIGDGEIFKPKVDSEIISQLDKHIVNIDKQYQQALLDKKELDSEALLLSLSKFKKYKKSLLSADTLIANETIEDVVVLELKKIEQEDGLTEKQQKRFKLFNERLEKLENGEPSSVNTFKIGNNSDGSFSLDFLSKENNTKLKAWTKTLEEKANKAFNSDPTQLIKEAVSKLPQLMFVLLPLFAALLKIFFIFSKRLYMEHLTVALHSHSFIFFCILLLQLLDFGESSLSKNYSMLSDGLGLLSSALLIWMPIYLFLMQKRIYKQGKFFTTIKFMLIGFSYTFLITFTAMAAFVWGVADS